MKIAYDKLCKTVNQFQQASKGDNAALSMLKVTVMDKQMAIIIHLDTIAKLERDVETMRIPERVNKLLISYSTSSYVIDRILPKIEKEESVFEKQNKDQG
ncbi:hypothetical protein Hanom_Chr01g00047291 [Helianthus anomalus]